MAKFIELTTTGDTPFMVDADYIVYYYAGPEREGPCTVVLNGPNFIRVDDEGNMVPTNRAEVKESYSYLSEILGVKEQNY